jgi:hypothetical protein
MYDLERITATGSIAGGPPDAEAAAWLAAGLAAFVGFFESVIR